MLLRLIFISLLFFGARTFAEHAFEPRPVHPLALTSDGARLLAVNPAEGRLSIFAVGPAEHHLPVLISEVPVGLIPVSVRLLNDDEAWVVNELSDTISVVSLPQNRTLATIQTGDEPGDLAFSQGKAYLTCSRDNSVEVYDVVTRTKIATIPLRGLLPRAIEASPDGSQIHVAFQHTSNGTTILSRFEAPAPAVPASMNPDLPAPPQVAQIVPTDHPDIDYTVLDHDLATIDVTSSTVSYRGGIGTNILALETLANGHLVAANTEARNLIGFEPELRSRFAFNRVTLLEATSTTQHELTEDPDATFPLLNTAAQASALAQPMALLAAENAQVWLAAYGSDRVALLDSHTGTISQRIDLRALDDANTPRNAHTVRGPRGLASHPTLPRLYSYNKLAHTLSIIDTTTHLVVGEIPLATFPDLDADLKMGRAFLQDARLSGNGSVSCATCHIDLERDGMAWDLGDPMGEMLSVTGFLRSVHLYNTPIVHNLHPMKGPMTTQTLIGLRDQSKLHWRGDKPTIQSFNSTFPKLMGGSQIAPEEMDKVADYLLTLSHHPNPNAQLDNNPPATLAGGNPFAGAIVFGTFENHCIECHSLPSGTSNNLDLASTVSSFQALKDPPLRTLYQRKYFNPVAGEESITGFGMLSDGTGNEFPIVHPYSLHILDEPSRPLATREQEKRDLTAFLLTFDTGTAAAIGAQVTFEKKDELPLADLQILTTLQEQSSGAFPNCDIILRGHFQGQPHNFYYDPESEKFLSDTDHIAPQTFAELFVQMQPGDILTATGVAVGSAKRLSTDRNEDEQRDGSQEHSNLLLDSHVAVTWSAPFAGWHLLMSSDLETWSPFTAPINQVDNDFTVPTGTEPTAFFQLQRSW